MQMPDFNEQDERQIRGRGGMKQEGREKGQAYDSVKQTDEVGPARSIEGFIVFATNIHDEAQEEDLHDLFAEFGEVRNLHLNLDRRTCFVKGYALIEYRTMKEARDAIEALNGSDFMDKKIQVDWAFLKGAIGAKQDRGGARPRARSPEKRKVNRT
eukprot:TRINITY_DN4718_c0_g1_i1.p1 TRINITY_DN4718_c0_g1~~TRINITY_DN4718_c0_g1_i1.p1  ORF type:complete len:156 (+),score=29.52 TRINITY_DN4718_c0_g1_i1:39-506(+)